MDLRHNVPRSPFDLLGGYAWLPRAIDKARAKQAGALGDYWFPGPFDDDFLAFLGVSLTEFESAVAEAADDDAVLDWVGRVIGKSQTEREAWRQWLWAAGPDPANGGQVFAKRLAEVAPGRTDIRTWCHLLAAEEGHPLPEGLIGLTEA